MTQTVLRLLGIVAVVGLAMVAATPEAHAWYYYHPWHYHYWHRHYWHGGYGWHRHWWWHRRYW